MDPRDSAEAAAFRKEVREWLAGNIPSWWKGGRGLAALADRDHDQAVARAKEWHRSLYDAGFIGLSWPVEYGGRGFGPAMQFVFQEEYARAKPPPLVNTIGLGWAGPAIMLHGTEAQRARYLPKILSGEEIWCQLFSEPGAGSDLAGLTTKAVRTDDSFVVNGQKVWTSYAREADFGILVARTDPDVPKHRGLSFFVLDMHSPGIDIRPIRQMSGGSEFNEVFFSDVRVPSENLVGELNGGWTVTLTTLMHERIGLSLGGGALWGQGPNIDDLVASMPDPDPIRRQKLASVYVDAIAHRLLKLRMITQAERGKIPGAEASIQKLFGDAWGQRLTTLAVESRGLRGLITEDGMWAGSFLFSPALTIGGGTTEVQRSIVGERILGLPKEPSR